MSKNSPLAPTMAEAVGFNDRRVSPGVRGPQEGKLVAKGHTKGGGDPSMGTANARPAVMESGGARHRIHPPTTMPTSPESAMTQANGRVVAPSAAVHYDKSYDPAVESSFDDAAVIAGIAPGGSRLRGYTSKG